MDVPTIVDTILSLLGSLFGIATLGTLVSSYVIKWTNAKPSARQWISWGIALLITGIALVIGIFLDLGAFASFDVTNWYHWLTFTVTAICSGLMSNGIFDSETVRKILEWLKAYPYPDKKS